MATTKTRHLHAVTDTPAGAPDPDVEVAQFYVRQQAAIAEAQQVAHAALALPDVEVELLEAVALIAEELARPGADRNTLLIALARDMYRHGHMDGTAGRKAAKQRLKAEQGTLAEVVKIETRERAELPAKERALRAATKP
jgi:hypothetical protein